MHPELLRYSCQMALPGFGEAAQRLLKDAKVLIAGAGGLGCPAAQYLAASGVGTIGIADYDTISVSNLHRQILYTPQEAGLKKAIIASTKLQQQNPGITVAAHDVKITSANVTELVSLYDLVVDCTDNFETRYLLNDACVLAGMPLVYGAIYQYEGQVAVWNVLKGGRRTPNYRDLFPEVNELSVPDCAEGGVIPTLAGIIGCMQANEVIKYITDTGELLAGKLLLLDAQTTQSRVIKTGDVTKTNITQLATSINVPTISPAKLKPALDTGRYELADVRTEQERAAQHIGGRHIPMAYLEQEMEYLCGRPVILYCASGKRSEQAARMILKKYPGAEVLSLEGGLKALNEI